jgi:hypothetical protein
MAMADVPQEPKTKRPYKIVGVKEKPGEPTVVHYQGSNYNLSDLSDADVDFLLKQGPAFPYIVPNK